MSKNPGKKVFSMKGAAALFLAVLLLPTLYLLRSPASAPTSEGLQEAAPVSVRVTAAPVERSC